MGMDTAWIWYGYSPGRQLTRRLGMGTFFSLALPFRPLFSCSVDERDQCLFLLALIPTAL